MEQTVGLEFISGPWDGERRPVTVGCVSITVGQPSRGPWAREMAQGSPVYGDEEQREVVDGWYRLEVQWLEGAPQPVMQWHPDHDEDDGA